MCVLSCAAGCAVQQLNMPLAMAGHRSVAQAVRIFINHLLSTYHFPDSISIQNRSRTLIPAHLAALEYGRSA
jgi:hypothetical protein